MRRPRRTTQNRPTRDRATRSRATPAPIPELNGAVHRTYRKSEVVGSGWSRTCSSERVSNPEPAEITEPSHASVSDALKLVRSLERRQIVFVVRPRVEGAPGVQRFFVLLSPERGQIHRRIVVGKKRMPEPGANEREWAYVDKLAHSPSELLADLRTEHLHDEDAWSPASARRTRLCARALRHRRTRAARARDVRARREPGAQRAPRRSPRGARGQRDRGCVQSDRQVVAASRAAGRRRRGRGRNVRRAVPVPGRAPGSVRGETSSPRSSRRFSITRARSSSSSARRTR